MGLGGAKQEDLNKSPVFGRLRLTLGLPGGFVADLGYTPPLSIRGTRARDLFAGIVGVPPGRVATGASAAELVGLVAASVPEGARMLAPEREFTSLLWPFLVRGCELRTVPAAGLAGAIDRGTDVVILSAVQSSSGRPP